MSHDFITGLLIGMAVSLPAGIWLGQVLSRADSDKAIDELHEEKCRLLDRINRMALGDNTR